MTTTSKSIARNPLWLHVAVLALITSLSLACGDALDEDDDRGYSGTYEGDDGLVAELFFEPDPPQTGEVDLLIDLSVDGEPIAEAIIDVEPWMPAHDHGANTNPEVVELDDGTYRVDNLSFSMAGLWELRLDVDWDEGSSKIIVELEVDG